MGKGKNYKKQSENLDKTKTYSPFEALSWIKENNYAKFDETIDISLNLGIDPRKADQIVRGSVVLPNGTGKQMRVLVFAEGEKAQEAEKAGADFVGSEDLVEKIKGGWLDFDICIATPDMMKHVGKIGKILGPRKLMPNPKSGTVTMEVTKTVEDFKKGRLEFRTDKNGVVHAVIGKVSFDLDKILQNYLMLVETITKAKPPASKGRFIKSIYVSSTMGQSLKIDTNRSLDIEKVA